MSSKQLKIGFIGFGEVGYTLAKGLKLGGLNDIYIFDKFSQGKYVNKKIQFQAKDAKVNILQNLESIANYSDIILSTVTPSAAKKVAEGISCFINEHHIFVDMNSISPTTKKEIAQIIEEEKAKFVDIAMMGSIASDGYKILMFASGKAALIFKKELERYGLNIRYIGEEPGSSSLIKMLRSVYMKGRQALLLEMFVVAYRYNVLPLVIESINESISKKSFIEDVKVIVPTIAIHSKRRADEMSEVISTLYKLGVSPIMSKAIKAKLKWVSNLNLNEYFNSKFPSDYMDILKAISILEIKNRSRNQKNIS